MVNGVALHTNRRFRGSFFSSLAALILVIVFVGFARTYYLAGMVKAPLPNLLIHLHAAVFSSWILLLITQISPYPDRHDYAFGRRLCPLAHSRGVVGSPGGADMLLPFAFVAGGLRPFVHWQDSSRHAPGQCVLDLAPTGTNSNRANRANRPLAALSNVGA